MRYTLSTALLAGSLLVGMIILLEVGRRIGLRQIARDPDGAHTGLGAIDGALRLPVSPRVRHRCSGF